MKEPADTVKINKLREDARLNIMLALEAAKVINDGMLIYLLRMSLDQLYHEEPPETPKEGAQFPLQ